MVVDAYTQFHRWVNKGMYLQSLAFKHNDSVAYYLAHGLVLYSFQILTAVERFTKGLVVDVGYGSAFWKEAKRLKICKELLGEGCYEVLITTKDCERFDEDFDSNIVQFVCANEKFRTLLHNVDRKLQEYTAEG